MIEETDLTAFCSLRGCDSRDAMMVVVLMGNATCTGLL
jgi:hypothetical protein